MGITIKSLYYIEYYNFLIDAYGEPFIDIFRIISPAKYEMCKRSRGTYYFDSPFELDVKYEVIFPLEGEEEDYYHILEPDIYEYEREEMYLHG